MRPPSGRLLSELMRRAAKERGFVLIIVVGMLTVLIVLGLSFAEQSRVDLLGASNSRDLAAADGLAEVGFQFALRGLADDRNVWSSANPAWDLGRGVGSTGRWGFSPLTDLDVAAGGVATPGGAAPNTLGAAPSRAQPLNFVDSVQALFWNEEDIGNNRAYYYPFTFDLAEPVESKYAQRHPADERMLLDTHQRQPLVRVRKFRVRCGTSYGTLQISMAPRDGGINLNDVFDPKTAKELPGWYDRIETGLADPDIPFASPDRRTLEYILGKRPEWANRHPESEGVEAIDPANQRKHSTQPRANNPSGNAVVDDGVYNFRAYFEPWGRSDVAPALANDGYLTGNPGHAPTIYYNAGRNQANRFNYEAPRYPLWAPAMNMSLEKDSGGLDITRKTDRVTWYPPGRFYNDPNLPSSSVGVGQPHQLFQGFGFDRQNPKRGGIGAAAADLWWKGDTTSGAYLGAGVYGHHKAHSFQTHPVARVMNGRFWSDLAANWYFGGGSGYSYYLGNRRYVTGSYDSLALGTNWHTPTAHIWVAGSLGKQHVLYKAEVERGFTRDPGAMPAAKPAATYAYPLAKRKDDFGLGNIHFLFNDARVSLRAHGIQENWGLNGQDHARGRAYDAINVNVTNFQVVYGLLTPEKIPSMLHRTAVAPHLHWKARLLDGAYKGMEDFKRYDPADTGDKVKPPVAAAGLIPPAPVTPLSTYDAYAIFVNADGDANFDDAAPADGICDAHNDDLCPYGAIDPATNTFKYFHPYPGADGINPCADKRVWPKDDNCYIDHVGPIPWKFSLHRAYRRQSDGTPLADPSLEPEPTRAVLGKMDYVTPDPRTGVAADDVFLDTHYDLRLSPNSEKANDNLNASSMPPRPEDVENWADWWLQRRTILPATRTDTVFRPASNKVNGLLAYPEGIAPSLLDPAPALGGVRTFPGASAGAVPHPIYGVPNPDYLQLYPDSDVSYHWGDQFRRYFPTVFSFDKTLPPPGGKPPCAPQKELKLMDVYSDVHREITPSVPVPKVEASNPTTSFVPAIGRDEAWRITRIGRKYQEIIADEIMDYQINPWWPNPCVHLTEVAVPLDKLPYESETRQAAGSTLSPVWQSYQDAGGAPAKNMNVPDYYAYFNRFWCRAAMKYKRGGNPATEERGTPYSAPDIAGGTLQNPVENRGIYPQTFQYFGQMPANNPTVNDQVIDFPKNTLEDQSGSEWRYVSGAAVFMVEPHSRRATARNHPFRHWADFVAMLGHLVYRSPMKPAGGPRNTRTGVQASLVCPAAFFDGSRIADADALQEPIVARAGFWPLSANYGEWDRTTADGYPPAPGAWAGDPREWRRRLDEWRGCDAGGLRVEHHYISERAANDVLVSFSNGRVRPIDFDGDGHVTMTRRSEIPDADAYWPGFPWHAPGEGAIANCEHQVLAADAQGDRVWKGGWGNTSRDEIIQGCVTLPIKFRSNTFRVSVVVELTDSQYKTVYTTKRFSRVYSRIPGTPANGIQVHGPYTGEFILHGTRSIGEVDPEMSWLGVR